MKLLALKQAKIEGDSEPKVITLGDFAISVDEITMVHSVIDKYDCIITGVIGIRTKQAEGFYVIGEFKDIVEQIEQNILT